MSLHSRVPIYRGMSTDSGVPQDWLAGWLAGTSESSHSHHHLGTLAQQQNNAIPEGGRSVSLCLDPDESRCPMPNIPARPGQARLAGLLLQTLPLPPPSLPSPPPLSFFSLLQRPFPGPVHLHMLVLGVLGCYRVEQIRDPQPNPPASQQTTSTKSTTHNPQPTSQNPQSTVHSPPSASTRSGHQTGSTLVCKVKIVTIQYNTIRYRPATRHYTYTTLLPDLGVPDSFSGAEKANIHTSQDQGISPSLP